MKHHHSTHTDHIRRETEAKWSGFWSAFAKALPHLMAVIALSVSLFNGCKIQHTNDWVGQHLDDKQKQIDQLKDSK